MIKDIVVSLSSRGEQDFAADYAASVAGTLGAQITGIAFLYEPVIPDGTLGGVPVELIELQRQENSKAAKGAISYFEAAVKKARVAAQTQIPSMPPSAAPPRCSPATPGASISRSSARRNASTAPRKS